MVEFGPRCADQSGVKQAQKTWEPSEEELAAILAEMQPIIREFVRRDRELLKTGSSR